MKALAAHWLDSYDWRAAEAALNRFPQFTARVDGLDLHYIHLRGSGPAPDALLISHGWPGSVFEFMEILEPLAHPERFGGQPEDFVRRGGAEPSRLRLVGQAAAPRRPPRRRRDVRETHGRDPGIPPLPRPGRRLGRGDLLMDRLRARARPAPASTST